ncbi:MAG: hemolysin family protein [Verrucomicrobiota bacterium]
MNLAALSLFLANASSLATEWPSAGTIVFQVGLILFVLLLNAFFVAAEISLVRLRAGQLEEALKEEKNKEATLLVKKMTKDLGRYLSASQLGITLTSLALGFLGEPFLARLLQPLFTLWGIEISTGWMRVISILIALLILGFLHITIGEQIPKTVARRRTLGTSRFCARPLKLFYFIGRPAIFFADAFSKWVLKVLFRLEPSSGQEAMHSDLDLAHLFEESAKSEVVTDTEKEILENAIALNDRFVRDVVTPRNDVVCIDTKKSFKENVENAIRSGHTRFPVVEGHLDKTLGFIHIKDLFKHFLSDTEPDLMKVKRELLEVPEMMNLDALLPQMQKERSGMALVVDEFGGSQGIVTLDNVVEEVVGDIQDEFDNEAPAVRWIGRSKDSFVVEGKLALYELAEHTELEIETEEVSSVGGYITQLLGHLPSAGESAEIEGYRVTVTRADGRRVLEARFDRLPPEKPLEEEGETESN